MPASARRPPFRTLVHLHLRDLIYGAIDGSVTTFAVVSGVIGAGLRPELVIVLGTAGLIGDGFSMAAGNYLGTQADQQREPPVGPAPRPTDAAMATFAAFLLAGAMPLLPYVASAVGIAVPNVEAASIGLTAATFFGVGAAKSAIVNSRWWAAGLESLLVGSAAAGLAYACGYVLRGLA